MIIPTMAIQIAGSSFSAAVSSVSVGSAGASLCAAFGYRFWLGKINKERHNIT